VKIAEVRHWVFDMDGTLTIAVHDFAAIRRALEIPEEDDILRCRPTKRRPSAPGCWSTNANSPTPHARPKAPASCCMRCASAAAASAC